MSSLEKLGRILGNDMSESLNIPKISAVKVVHLKSNQSYENSDDSCHRNRKFSLKVKILGPQKKL